MTRHRWKTKPCYVPTLCSSWRTPVRLELNRLPGGYSSVVPPDPIPNSEVKRARADGSVA